MRCSADCRTIKKLSPRQLLPSTEDLYYIYIRTQININSLFLNSSIFGSWIFQIGLPKKLRRSVQETNPTIPKCTVEAITIPRRKQLARSSQGFCRRRPLWPTLLAESSTMEALPVRFPSRGSHSREHLSTPFLRPLFLPSRPLLPIILNPSPTPWKRARSQTSCTPFSQSCLRGRLLCRRRRRCRLFRLRRHRHGRRRYIHHRQNIIDRLLQRCRLVQGVKVRISSEAATQWGTWRIHSCRL